MFHHVVWCSQASSLFDRSWVFTYFFVRSLLIALMMEAVSTFETSVNFYQTTRCNIPEDSHLHLPPCSYTPSRRVG
jgi:hypothetical protein